MHTCMYVCIIITHMITLLPWLQYKAFVTYSVVGWDYHYDWCISSGVLPSSHIKGDSLSLQFNEWVQTKYLLTKKHLLE